MQYETGENKNGYIHKKDKKLIFYNKLKKGKKYEKYPYEKNP